MTLVLDCSNFQTTKENQGFYSILKASTACEYISLEQISLQALQYILTEPSVVYSAKVLYNRLINFTWIFYSTTP